MLQHRTSTAAFVKLLYTFVFVFFFKYIHILCFSYKAVYNYKPQNADELELREGDIVRVMEKCDDGWFVGKRFENIIFFQSIV